MDLIHDIIVDGEDRSGRNGPTKSLFSRRLEFNVGRDGFPLLTTKRVFWRGVVEELLWFLRGSSDANELSDMGVHIWDGNSTREFLDSVGLVNVPPGNIGAGYGHQWRNFGGTMDTNGTDQLRFVINELRTNPHGRRAIISAWNPLQLFEAALPPCHVMYIFYISTKGLSCQMTQRSADVAAGLPFNIASTSLFTSILAHVLGLQVDRIIIDVADAHLYEQHIENAKIQMNRVPNQFPTLTITKSPPPPTADTDSFLTWIEELKAIDCVIQGYAPQPAIRYEMIP